MGGSSKPTVQQAGTLDPTQLDFVNALTGVGTGQLGYGVPGYPGQLSPTVQPLQQGGWDLVSHLLQENAPGELDTFSNLDAIMQGTSMGSQGLESLTKPWDPTFATDQWTKAIQAPTMLNWNQNVLPVLQEKFAAYDAAGGGGAAKTITDEAVNLQTGLESNLASTLLSDKATTNQNILSAGNTLNSNTMQAAGLNMNTLMSIINAASGGGAQQYGVASNTDTANYNEFLRTAPQSNPWISQALQAAGIPTFENIVSPGQTSGIPGMMAGAGGLFGGLAKMSDAGMLSFLGL